MTLPVATCATNELIKAALPLIEKLFTRGEYYKKAGVMLSGIVPDKNIQGNLFNQQNNDGAILMSMVDNVNFAMRDDVLKFASSGTKKNWKMRQELRSPRYTTRWDEIKTVS
jgi:DNA polymerase V